MYHCKNFGLDLLLKNINDNQHIYLRFQFNFWQIINKELSKVEHL